MKLYLFFNFISYFYYTSNLYKFNKKIINTFKFNYNSLYIFNIIK